MNYSEALSFTFRDEVWFKKIAIGGLIGFISFYAGLFFIFVFFLFGYYIGIVRNVIKGEESPLPDWSDMSKIFVDGILGGIIFLFYFVVIGGICALFITNVAMDSYMHDFEKVSLIVFLSITTLIALWFFINYGIVQFAATENFAAAFSVTGMVKLVKSNLANFFAIIVFSLILHGILFCAGLGILSPFTNFWGLVIQAHLFGQCAKEMDISATTVQAV